MTREWNATAYHKVSGPQTSWGQKVLDRLTVRGDEHVIDAGCGSGRLTAELMERLPRGRLVALDRSWNMLMTARANLRPVFGHRVGFVQVSLPQLPFAESVDLVFSTATFHWVRDHASLFDNIYRTLKRGGRLVAQCGGGPNLAHAHRLAEQVMHRPPFAVHFERWAGIWEFASAETTADRLRDAGFQDVVTSIEPATDGLQLGDGLSRVRRDGHLPCAHGDVADRGSEAGVPGRGHQSRRSRRSAVHAGLLEIEHVCVESVVAIRCLL